MIYKLIVNAAFLAIGYYIGKEVGVRESARDKFGAPAKSASEYTGKTSSERSTAKH